MKGCLEKYWLNISKSIAEDKPKEEILKLIRDSLNDIEMEIGWLDERRQNAEDSLIKLLDDYEDLSNNLKEEEESTEDNFYIHSPYPLIFTKDEFLSKDICEHIIELAQPNLKEATIYNETSQRDEVSDYRQCKVCYFPHDYNETITYVVEKISKIVSVSPTRAEKLQVISYDEGEFFDYHTDAFDLNDINMTDGGQRIFTAMVYLNDVPEGGETHFKLINVKVQPEQGRLLVFSNCLKNSNTQNPQTLHAGMPVIRGKKYALNLWYRENVRSEYTHLLKNARTI